IFEDLVAMGYPLMINKKQYSEITNQSISTVNTKISNGRDICKYLKMGGKHNSQVLFNLRDVAEFLSLHSIEVA
ncbi:MAG: hypothetical protein JW870_17890, partial [Candidatus Delongbacteria bacterium]|nr:hypothetical protein [Candidatus Delongbacteria bacterium]